MAIVLRSLPVLLLAGSILAGTQAMAYPERRVTMLVPFAAGGAVDIIARILSEPLAKALGQPVVIENRPGSGGNIGFGTVARAQPDGHTILMGSSSFAINPSLYPRVPYDPIKDFAAIADLVYYPCIIGVRPDLGINTLAEFISYAKANPGKLNFATPGTGTVPHLAMELLKLRAGINLVHIPYPGGGQAVQALMGRAVEAVSLATPQALPQVRSGNIRAIALTGRERWPDLPDLATLREHGYRDLIAETWQGLLVPAGTPQAVIDRIAQETVAILRGPEIVARYRQAGLLVTGKGPQALRERLAEELPRWKETIEKGGISIN